MTMEDYIKIVIIGVVAIVAGATAHQAWDLCIALYHFMTAAKQLLRTLFVVGLIVGGFTYVSKLIGK
ncbi:hypothetical protein [Methanolobus bombayensis]|uniref:hypothetical protein n=1 Tax=Methanolobus bombayensis TaxID=38023 RepID=UPI001AE5C331|nr:hypothetical protein [Methanolobus bombayensis]MBP1908274.1 hypothetical protein [Methanolobus bombayensis]